MSLWVVTDCESGQLLGIYSTMGGALEREEKYLEQRREDGWPDEVTSIHPIQIDQDLEISV